MQSIKMKTICLSEGTFLRLLAPIYTIIVLLVLFTTDYEGVEINPEANQKQKAYQSWSIALTIYGTAISICIYYVCKRKCLNNNKLKYYKIMFPLNLSVDLFMMTAICLSKSYIWFKDGLFNVEWFCIFHYYTLEIGYIRVICSHLYTYNNIFCKVYHFCLMCFKYIFVLLLMMTCLSVILFIIRLYEMKERPPMFMTTYKIDSIGNLSTKDGDVQNMTCAFKDNQTYILHSTTFLRVKDVDEPSGVFSKPPTNESKDGCQCVSKYVHINDFPEADNVIFNCTCPHESRSFNVMSIGDCKTIFFTPLNLHWHGRHTLVFGPFNENVGMKYLGSYFFNKTINKESHIPSKKEVNNVKNKKSILQCNRTIYNNFSVDSRKMNISKLTVLSMCDILYVRTVRLIILIGLDTIDVFPRRYLVPKISFDLFSYLLKHIPRPSKIHEDTVGTLHILVDNWLIFLLEYIRNSCIGDLLNCSTNYNLICIQCIYEHFIELNNGLSIAILVVIWCFITLITKMFYKLASLNALISESLDIKIKQKLHEIFDFKDEHKYLTVLSCNTNDDFVVNTLLPPLKATRNKVLSRKDFLVNYAECTYFKMCHKLSKISKKYIIVTSNDFFLDGICTYHYLGNLVLEGVKSKNTDKKDILIIQIENIDTESEFISYLSDMKTIDFTKNSLPDNIEEMRKWALAENLNLDSENHTYTALYA